MEHAQLRRRAASGCEGFGSWVRPAGTRWTTSLRGCFPVTIPPHFWAPGSHSSDLRLPPHAVLLWRLGIQLPPAPSQFCCSHGDLGDKLVPQERLPEVVLVLDADQIPDLSLSDPLLPV